MFYHIDQATEENIAIIHDLIHQIYFPTYQNILAKKQIEFMLEKSYSIDALLTALADEQLFYILKEDNMPVGFIALRTKNKEILRIEKLYLLPNQQGKGLGSKLINFAIEQGKVNSFETLELNVNRNNKAYLFYLNQGFKIIKEIDIPYFGFVLDDYIMQKQLI